MAFDKKVFAENLRVIRAKLDVSQEKFARLVGLSTDSIVRYESGNGCTPSIDTIFAICDAVNINPNELMGWEKVA